MIVARGVAVLLMLLVWLFGIFDVRATEASRVRTMPKEAWLALVLFVPALGTILWLRSGRPARSAPGRPSTPGVPPEYDRPGRARATNPDDDAQFLEQLRKRAEEQRRRALGQDGDESTP